MKVGKFVIIAVVVVVAVGGFLYNKIDSDLNPYIPTPPASSSTMVENVENHEPKAVEKKKVEIDYNKKFPSLNFMPKYYNIDKKMLPGIDGYEFPSKDDIVPGTAWHYYLIESGENTKGPEYKPYLLINDFNKDGIDDMVWLLKSKDKDNEGLLCLYISKGINIYDVYKLDEIGGVTQYFITPLGAGDEMCLYESNEPFEITALRKSKHDGFVMTVYEGSYNLMVEYNPDNGEITYGFICKFLGGRNNQ